MRMLFNLSVSFIRANTVGAEYSECDCILSRNAAVRICGFTLTYFEIKLVNVFITVSRF